VDTYKRQPYAYICLKVAGSSTQHSIVVVARSTLPIFTAAPSRHVRILMYLNKKNFWALSTVPRGSTPPFSNYPSHATYHRIFPHLSTSILASRRRWISTSNVIPTPKPTRPPLDNIHPIVSSIHYLFIFSNKKLFTFLGLFPRPPGLKTPIFEFLFSRYVTYNFFPPLHLYLRPQRCGGA